MITVATSSGKLFKATAKGVLHLRVLRVGRDGMKSAFAPRWSISDAKMGLPLMHVQYKTACLSAALAWMVLRDLSYRLEFVRMNADLSRSVER